MYIYFKHSFGVKVDFSTNNAINKYLEMNKGIVTSWNELFDAGNARDVANQ